MTKVPIHNDRSSPSPSPSPSPSKSTRFQKHGTFLLSVLLLATLCFPHQRATLRNVPSTTTTTTATTTTMTMTAARDANERIETPPPVSSSTTRTRHRHNHRHAPDRAHYHDYAVFLIHYHKTGYVLSRELKNLVNEMEMMVYEQRKKRWRRRRRWQKLQEKAVVGKKRTNAGGRRRLRLLSKSRLQLQSQPQPESESESELQSQSQSESESESQSQSQPHSSQPQQPTQSHQQSHPYHFDNTSRKYRHIQFEQSGLFHPHRTSSSSVRIAFDQIGNWARSAFPVRDHDRRTSCPGGLAFRSGAMYVQESPDLFCDDTVLEKALVRGEALAGGGMRRERLRQKGRRMNGGEEEKGMDGGKRIRDNGPPIKYLKSHRNDISTTKHTNATPVKVKIVHFVRNPFDMVISNYRYHSQDPTPEKWVHIDDPCQHLYGDGVSLADHVIPTLTSEWNNHSPFELSHPPSIDYSSFSSSDTHTLRQTLSDITSLCHTLYQSKPATRNQTFYEHLRNHLDERDGLRLSTAQMTVASSEANGHLAGGDVLRMANNVVRLEGLRARAERARGRRRTAGAGGAAAADDDDHRGIQLLTISMDDFIKNVTENTMKFMDFVFGDDDGADEEEFDGTNDDFYSYEPIMPRNVRWEVAQHQQEKYDRIRKRSKHVTTQSQPSGKKEEWKDMLRNSPELGPILSMAEGLVNEALSVSG